MGLPVVGMLTPFTADLEAIMKIVSFM
jgi:hypothetical protein